MVIRTLTVFLGSVLLIAAVLTTGAAPVVLAQSTGPSVEIISPATNDKFEQGQPIIVSSRSVDAQGIIRVDLVANGQVVASQPNPQPEPNQALLVSQFWVPQIIGNQVSRWWLTIPPELPANRSLCLCRLQATPPRRCLSQPLRPLQPRPT